MSALALPLLVLMLVWFVYAVTTYALPCLAGLIVARYAFETGAGFLGAFVVWGLTAILASEMMRWLLVSVSQPAVRLLLSVTFVTPSVAISYFLLDDFSVGLVPSEIWRQALCMIGASVAGLIATVRYAKLQT